MSCHVKGIKGSPTAAILRHHRHNPRVHHLFLPNFCLFCSPSPFYSFFLSQTKCHCYFFSYFVSPISIILFSRCSISYLEKMQERFSSAKIAMLGKEVLYAFYIPFFLQYLSPQCFNFSPFNWVSGLSIAGLRLDSVNM